MTDDKRCPDCGEMDGEHLEGCHVAWADSLKDTPIDRRIKPNAFTKLIKQATSETPIVERTSE